MNKFGRTSGNVTGNRGDQVSLVSVHDNIKPSAQWGLDKGQYDIYHIDDFLYVVWCFRFLKVFSDGK